MRILLIVFLTSFVLVSCSGSSKITFQNRPITLLPDEKQYADRILLGLKRLVANVKICNEAKGGSFAFGGLSINQSNLRGYPTFFATCSGETVYFDQDIQYRWEDRYR